MKAWAFFCALLANIAPFAFRGECFRPVNFNRSLLIQDDGIFYFPIRIFKLHMILGRLCTHCQAHNQSQTGT